MKHTYDKINHKKTEAVTNNLIDKPIQNKAITLEDNRNSSILQKKVNNTGLPDNLKSGIENLSGHAMDDVKVHYNSNKPAQLNAHAYAQGSEIHLASGQEKHLPHEAWHVVQQKQGRVKPTMQMKGKVPINDDAGLEKEADVMGASALATTEVAQRTETDSKHQSVDLSVSVKQLKRENAIANGVTHLVRLNEQGSLYQENFMDNEIAETRAGELIVIETDNKLLSRRGPNQELAPQRDEPKEREQLWINALRYNKQELPPHSYIRDGTFSVQPESALGAKSKAPSSSGSHASLLLPYTIASDSNVYMIDASHRGDMYHLRAALAVHRAPLIIFNFKGENDLTHYLANAPGTQVYKVAYNPAKPREIDFQSGLVLRMFNVLSEADATHKIAGAVEQKDAISKSMTSVSEELTPDVVRNIRDAVVHVFGSATGNIALMMYRDSGQTSLVYPELDSGAALPELARMMHEKGLTPVFCGAPGGAKLDEISNIGPYWKALEGIQVGGNRDPLKYKRDIEAEFMRQAYKMGKFRIVVGFRSGMLDLFTFLGIPTISISLKRLVGEDRHSQLAHNPNWQRTNIQYDKPRSNVTRLMEGRGESELYMSPFWKMRGFKPLNGENNIKTASAPEGFHQDDVATIETGLDVGIGKLSPITESHRDLASPSAASSLVNVKEPVKEAKSRIGRVLGVVTKESIAEARERAERLEKGREERPVRDRPKKVKPVAEASSVIDPKVLEQQRLKWEAVWATESNKTFVIGVNRYLNAKSVEVLPSQLLNQESWDLPEGGRSVFNMEYAAASAAYKELMKKDITSFKKGEGLVKGKKWNEAISYMR